MTLYHIPTVYLIIGILYLILPLMVWLVLINQPSRVTSLWCVGGEILGIGLVMVGLREHVPAWVSYAFANGLMWMGGAIQVIALRRALDQGMALKQTTLFITIGLFIFEYFRVVLEDAILRFTWSTLIFTAIFSYIGYLSWRIAQFHQLKSARWLTAVYGLTAFIMFVRMERVQLGLIEPDVISQGIDSALTVITGLLISTLGNFAFVGVFLERANLAEMKATDQRARQEESVRLGEQIAQLERQRTLGTMSASFAHELSQPLTAILMDAQAIKTSMSSLQPDPQEILESIEEIENSTYRTVKLLERIRNFIRPAQSDYEYIDFKTLLDDVAQLLTYEIRKLKIHFEFDVETLPCLVHGDRVQLSQIVLNVYRNAMQAMESSAEKKIFVSLEHSDHRVVLRVRDTGPGIAPDLMCMVEQPFFTSKEDGLGVGLSISSAIAEMHSGNLTISNAVDGGAIVELSLPSTIL
jgi:signal transduction histidine kinase